MLTTSARFSAAIVESSAILSIARGLTCCFPPNSDVCTPSPSMTVPASPTRSISPWGYSSEHPSPSLLPDRLLHPAAALRLLVFYLGAKCGSQGGGSQGLRSQGDRSQG